VVRWSLPPLQAAAILLGAACESEQYVPREVSCVELTDIELACNSGARVCRPGTVCTARDGSLAGWPATAATCEVPRSDHIESDWLTNGFRVAEFELIRAKGEEPSFSFRVPSRAEVVSCALFVCPPVVQQAPSDGRGHSY
jgi:hypothetical protein